MEAGSDKNVRWVMYKEPWVGQRQERSDRIGCEE